VTFPNDIWSAHVSYREFGKSYDPSLGFVTRNNFRRVEPRIGFAPRTPGIDWLRRIDTSVQFRAMTSLDTGILEEREWALNLLGLDFESGDNIDIRATHTYEYLDETFEISDGVDILSGRYGYWDYRLNARTAGRRKVSLFGGMTWGGFWNGDRTQYNGRVSFRPAPGLTVSTNLEYNDVTFPTGSFTASLYELETDWNPSPWVAITNQLQYDDVSELVGLFARLRWIVKPGNDVYLVYTHNWQYQHLDPLDPDQRDLMTLSRGASIKVNYTYRF
jgi:hypothetical protein